MSCRLWGEAEAKLGQAGVRTGQLDEGVERETQFIPLFLGIAMGITVGLIPISFPLPVPVRLGLAGVRSSLWGMVLSRLWAFGATAWHIPTSTNLAFRELGITLFLAAVGLKAAFMTVLSSTGVLAGVRDLHDDIYLSMIAVEYLPGVL